MIDARADAGDTGVMTPTRQHARHVAREAVLDAAERLLRADGQAAFSMRELAAEARVSFATPFNQFGSKAAILHALSDRRIVEMEARLRGANLGESVIERVPAAVSVAAGSLLEEPEVNRALIGSLGAPAAAAGSVNLRSRELWAMVIADCDGIEPKLRPIARTVLPRQLALLFRGCLSFWAAGEIRDADLVGVAQAASLAALLGFVVDDRRDLLLRQLS